MVGFIVAIATLCASGLFLCIVLKQRFLEMLSFSLLGTIAVLYLFGLFGLLKLAVYVVVMASFILGILGVLIYIRMTYKNGMFKQLVALKKIPSLLLRSLPFIVFISGSAVIVYITIGKVPTTWDEFTHWALSAKAMFLHDSFATDPSFGVMFTSYPPAMTLFQYFMQVCNNMFRETKSFSDWLLYTAYYEAFLILLLPWLQVRSPYKKRDIAYVFIFAAIIFMAPMFGFPAVYTTLYIDAFLAIIAAYTLFLATQKKDFPHAFLMGLALLTLMLTKDAGAYFAYAALIIYIVTALFFSDYRHKSFSRKLTICLIPVIFVIYTSISWKYELASKGANLMFSAPVDISRLPAMLTPGSYYRQVIANFAKRFFADILPISLWLPVKVFGSQISLLTCDISFFMLSLLYSGLCLALYIKRKKNSENISDGTCCLLLSSIAIYAIYVVGLLVIYMFKFSEYEAVTLASFDRYTNIGYVSWLMVILFSAIKYFIETKEPSRKQYMTWMVILLFFISINGGRLWMLVDRTMIQLSDEHKENYAITSIAKTIIPEDARVYIISQQGGGYDHWSIRYELYPRSVNENNSWALGDPDDETDLWTHPVTAEQWHNELVDYDYVLLFSSDDYITNDMSSCYEEGTEITPSTIYKVDKSTGLLFQVSQ